MSSSDNLPPPQHIALLPAAGVGARMGVDHPKQYLDIHGHPMIWHAIKAFAQCDPISRIVVVISAEDGWWDSYDWSAFKQLEVLRCGGQTRAESVLNGLQTIATSVQENDWVLVHDAARPCLSQTLLNTLISTLIDDPVGGILAAPVADTLKRESTRESACEGEGGRGCGRIASTVSREKLWGAQTPQMFPHGMLMRALQQAGTQVTDEASAIEAMGLSPRLVESDLSNLKVTYPRDLEVAAWWLEKGHAGQ